MLRIISRATQKNTNAAVTLANDSSRSAKTKIETFKNDRYTLERWKLYLESCATYHPCFTKKIYTDTRTVTRLLSAAVAVMTAPP